MTTLPDLIKLLENATGPARDMDGLIAKQIGWHRVEPRHAGNKHGSWISPEDFCGVMSDGSPRLDGLHGTEMHRDPPKFSSSIDAALTLVPDEYLPGLETSRHDGVIYYQWSLWKPKNRPGFTGGHYISPIALCIAALRSRLPTPQDGER